MYEQGEIWQTFSADLFWSSLHELCPSVRATPKGYTRFSQRERDFSLLLLVTHALFFLHVWVKVE